MSKEERQKVFNKYAGKCAYCGCELQKGWHVDHLEPIRRYRSWNGKRYVITGMDHPERDCFENKVPACAKCNINKHSDSVEQFRQAIAMYLESLNKRMVQYQMAKKYGLVQETGIEVKFYFETSKEDNNKK